NQTIRRRSRHTTLDSCVDTAGGLDEFPKSTMVVFALRAHFVRTFHYSTFAALPVQKKFSMIQLPTR
ncbi:hypothetical protein Q6245_29805, partial [Klebsiella pneumoniae]|uniref:hypothetical protein n=1 Tax=Klebsiella pneumoniae TaxID=573 RepID=UPI00273050A3